MPVMIAVFRNAIPTIVSNETDAELLEAIAPYTEIPDWAKASTTQLREWLAAQPFPSGLFKTVEDAQAYTKRPKICPECGHEFKGNGWDGIDAHWRARHNNIMAYEEAWPLIRTGRYTPKAKG